MFLTSGHILEKKSQGVPMEHGAFQCVCECIYKLDYWFSTQHGHLVATVVLGVVFIETMVSHLGVRHMHWQNKPPKNKQQLYYKHLIKTMATAWKR